MLEVGERRCGARSGMWRTYGACGGWDCWIALELGKKNPHLGKQRVRHPRYELGRSELHCGAKMKVTSGAKAVPSHKRLQEVWSGAF
jgi:hypothetical protein